MADRAERVKLIKRLQELRGGTTVIAYVTSTRENLEAQMGMDCVPLVYRHLKAAKATPESKVDLFIHSNGGDGVVPWRLVSPQCLSGSVLERIAGRPEPVLDRASLVVPRHLDPIVTT